LKALKTQLKPSLALMILLAFLAYSFFAFQVSAEPTVNLSINKNIGYNFGSDINGQFIVSAHVSNEVVRVEFYLNGTLQYNDTAAPFSWAFDTTNYALGTYNITAVAYDSSGQQATAGLNQNFVEVPAFWSTFLPIIIAIVVIVAVVASFWALKHSSRLTKCPKCGYVFSPNRMISIKLGVWHYTRCPECGKYFLGKPLKEAPKKDEPEQTTSDPLSEEERLRRDIENSKYEK
jgi:ribosomal protein L32